MGGAPLERVEHPHHGQAAHPLGGVHRVRVPGQRGVHVVEHALAGHVHLTAAVLLGRAAVKAHRHGETRLFDVALHRHRGGKGARPQQTVAAAVSRRALGDGARGAGKPPFGTGWTARRIHPAARSPACRRQSWPRMRCARRPRPAPPRSPRPPARPPKRRRSCPRGNSAPHSSRSFCSALQPLPPRPSTRRPTRSSSLIALFPPASVSGGRRTARGGRAYAPRPRLGRCGQPLSAKSIVQNRAGFKKKSRLRRGDRLFRVIFVAGGHAAPDVPLLLVLGQHFLHLVVKAVVDPPQAAGHILMYGRFGDAENPGRGADGLPGSFQDVFAQRDGPLFGIAFHT